MGGRGAFFNKKDGLGRIVKKEWHTVANIRGIKVLEKNDPTQTPGLPFMSAGPGAIYAVFNSKEELGSIAFYDKDRKMVKRVDFDSSHGKLKPHTNITDEAKTIETREPTAEELEMGERLKKWKANTTKILRL